MSNSVEDFIDGLTKLTRRVKVDRRGHDIHITTSSPRERRDEITSMLPESELARTIEVASTLSLDGEITPYSDRSLEIGLIKTSPWFGLRSEQDAQFVDHENGVQYVLGTPSPDYAILLIRETKEWLVAGKLHPGLLRPSSQIYNAHEDDKARFWQIVCACLPVRKSLQIKSAKSLSIKAFHQLADSFLFQLGYNFDLQFLELRSLEDVGGPSSRAHSRTSSRGRSPMDAPRRLYVRDLLYHYRMALSSESPYLQFICYYHVLEHFFEQIYNDELLRKMTERMTSPGFSYNRASDLKGLAKIVQDWSKKQRDDTPLDEKTALRLVIRRFVDFNRLRAEVNSVDSDLIEYYKDNKVTFAEADSIDLSEADPSRLSTAIADRVYKIRNAIVHSKDGSKPKYTPFRHDRELSREIPLLRILAEEIIISTSSVFDSSK